MNCTVIFLFEPIERQPHYNIRNTPKKIGNGGTQSNNIQCPNPNEKRVTYINNKENNGRPLIRRRVSCNGLYKWL